MGRSSWPRPCGNESTPAAPRRFTSIGVTASITGFRCQPERSREFRAHLVVPLVLIAALRRPLVRLGDHTQHRAAKTSGAAEAICTAVAPYALCSGFLKPKVGDG